MNVIIPSSVFLCIKLYMKRLPTSVSSFTRYLQVDTKRQQVPQPQWVAFCWLTYEAYGDTMFCGLSVETAVKGRRVHPVLLCAYAESNAGSASDEHKRPDFGISLRSPGRRTAVTNDVNMTMDAFCLLRLIVW